MGSYDGDRLIDIIRDITNEAMSEYDITDHPDWRKLEGRVEELEGRGDTPPAVELNELIVRITNLETTLQRFAVVINLVLTQPR